MFQICLKQNVEEVHPNEGTLKIFKEESDRKDENELNEIVIVEVEVLT